MSNTKKNTKEIGDLGEKIAVNYLKRKGFTILETNYWRKWGELDIIARKGDIVHFIEVKTTSYKTRDKLQYSVSHETWRPEELVHKFKFHQIAKAVQTWILDYKYEGEFQIDVIAVRVVPRETYATVKYIENIISD